MASQPQVGFTKAVAASGRRTLAVALYWTPVWLPLALFVQIALLGLKPALAERARLEREATVVVDRKRTTAEELVRLESGLAAWHDPVYRERRRRIQRRLEQERLATLPGGAD